MENQKIPKYEAIHAIATEEKWTAEKVIDCYKDEVDRLSMVAARQPDGGAKQEISEDMRQSVTKKLIGVLPQSPLKGMERGNIGQAKKEQGAEASI